MVKVRRLILNKVYTVFYCSSGQWSLTIMSQVSCKENHKFNLCLFRKQSLKIAFDALYGLSHGNIATHELIELLAYLHFDGKIAQGSKFEMQMSETIINYFKNTRISRRCLALCWIFCKAHAGEPSGISIEVRQRTIEINELELSLYCREKRYGNSIVLISRKLLLCYC